MKPSKFTHPLRWYAESYNVSIATVKRWSAKGLDLDNPDSISIELMGQKHEPENFCPRPKEDSPDCAAEWFIECQGRIMSVARLISDGRGFEGYTKEQSINGSVRMMGFLAESLWKGTVLAMEGWSLAQIREELGKENLPGCVTQEGDDE